jgi:hypothetical protein
LGGSSLIDDSNGTQRLMPTPLRRWFAFRLRTLFVLVAVLAITGAIQNASGRWGIDSYVYGWPLPFYDSSPQGQGLVGPGAFHPFVFVLDVCAVAASIFAGIMLVARKFL